MPPVFSAVDEEGVQDLMCVICLEPWQDPVQLEPCQHIFCRKCLKIGGSEGEVQGVNLPPRCPMCRGPPTKISIPNRILVNMAKEAKMKCTCGWQGSNEEKKNHRVCSASNNNRTGSGANSRSASGRNSPGSTGGGGGGSPFIMNANPQQVNFVPRTDGFPSQQQQRDYQYQQQQQAYNSPSFQNTNNNNPHPASFQAYNNNQQQNNNRAFVNTNPGPWDQFGLEQFVYDHILTVFMTFDTDDSGYLDRRELERMARYLNFAHSKQDIDKMFREMDTQRRGELDMNSFCTWLSRNKPNSQALYGLSEIEYHDALFQFHEFDADNSGLIDKDEFSRLAIRMRYANNPSDANRLFDRIDADHSGQIDLHELLSFLRDRKYQGRPPISPPNMSSQQQQQQNVQYGGGGGAPAPPPPMNFLPPSQHQNFANGVPAPNNPPQPSYAPASGYNLSGSNNFNNSFNGSGSNNMSMNAAPIINNMNGPNNANWNYPPQPGQQQQYPQASDYYNNNNNQNNNRSRSNSHHNNNSSNKKDDCVIQ